MRWKYEQRVLLKYTVALRITNKSYFSPKAEPFNCLYLQFLSPICDFLANCIHSFGKKTLSRTIFEVGGNESNEEYQNYI